MKLYFPPGELPQGPGDRGEHQERWQHLLQGQRGVEGQAEVQEGPEVREPAARVDGLDERGRGGQDQGRRGAALSQHRRGQ